MRPTRGAAYAFRNASKSAFTWSFSVEQRPWEAPG
jgi:hypothetical protein